MEPLFRRLVVGVVPQPKAFPPPPFPREQVQRAYFDVSQDHPYQQFNMLPGESGYQLVNGLQDTVLIQPMLLRIETPITLTAQSARQKAHQVLDTLTKRLQVASYLQAGVNVMAHVVAPGNPADAKEFVTNKLMDARELALELGEEYFGGGFKFRSISDDNLDEQNLSIEPLVTNNEYIYVEYDVQHRAPITGGIEQVSGWVDEAIDFVTNSAMRVLEEKNK